MKPIHPEIAYNRALEVFRVESKWFREVTEKYRARLIGDEEFLAARRAFDLADKASDEAEKRLQDAGITEIISRKTTNVYAVKMIITTNSRK